MKWLYNLVDSWAQKESVLFDFIVWGNEVYIRFQTLFLRVKIKHYQKEFLVGEKTYRLESIGPDWIPQLVSFFKEECSDYTIKRFNPHRLDKKSLEQIFARKHYIPLGIFQAKQLVGYCVIRLFYPKKGLYAIVVADQWQGKGIGSQALRRQIEIIRSLGYHPFSQVKKWNKSSLRMIEKAGVRIGGDLGESVIILDADEGIKKIKEEIDE